MFCSQKSFSLVFWQIRRTNLCHLNHYNLCFKFPPNIQSKLRSDHFRETLSQTIIQSLMRRNYMPLLKYWTTKSVFCFDSLCFSKGKSRNCFSLELWHQMLFKDKNLYPDFNGLAEHILCWSNVFGSLFSELSLALNKDGLWLTKTDTQPERTLRWATHRSRFWYTPLVEVNQAILAWSF